MFIFKSMEAYLRPLVSCRLYYDNHLAEKGIYWSKSKNRKLQSDECFR